jgi:hypothetical protein
MIVFQGTYVVKKEISKTNTTFSIQKSRRIKTVETRYGCVSCIKGFSAANLFYKNC